MEKPANFHNVSVHAVQKHVGSVLSLLRDAEKSRIGVYGWAASANRCREFFEVT